VTEPLGVRAIGITPNRINTIPLDDGRKRWFDDSSEVGPTRETLTPAGESLNEQGLHWVNVAQWFDR
jgi:hypothetical protein